MNRLHIIFLILFCGAILSSCKNQKSTLATVQHAQGKAAGQQKLSIVDKLKENSHLDVEERIALFHQLKKEQPHTYDYENEGMLNMYGYGLLWNEQVAEALAIFKLIVAEFPTSANAYDSLGEAYLAMGNKKLSLSNYEKSLALNPDNFGAEDQIERIKYPDRKPPTDAEKFVQVFTSQQYKEDLRELGEKLIEGNPSALKFIEEDAFWKIVEEKKALITDQTTYGEFAWHCNEIIASINCSHTSKGGFYPEFRMLPMSLRFPVKTRWVKDGLFIINPLNNAEKVSQKDEITHINGVLVADLMEDIYQHIPSQGYIETTKKHEFNTWSSTLIPYALLFPASYEIQVKGKANPIRLNPSESFREPLFDPSIPRCENGLCLEYLDKGSTAIMTISTFNFYRWNNLKEFESFMDHSFKEIKEKGIENLVIDLRFNGGGSPESSIYLLRYLANNPFTYFTSTDYGEGEGVQELFPNRFKGNRYYLIDGNGSSTTGHFMSMVKTLKLGTIVGEELGSNQFCTGGQMTYRLFHTKMEYYVGNSTNRTSVTGLPDETGILPDHYVTQSIDEYLNKVDAVKAYTLNLIQN